MLYWYGQGLGWRSLFRGQRTRTALKQIIVPVNYWRTLEYRLVHAALQPAAGEKILDIGSPKLYPFFLADRIGAKVCATDIEDYFIRDYERLRQMRGLAPDRFHARTADGRQLPFDAGQFDKVVSISVLEHIPDQGDSDCAREIARVLRPGGIAVITVPFSPQSRDEFRAADQFYWAKSSANGAGESRVFFQRRYSEEDLQTRLIGPSGMAPLVRHFLGERLRLSEHTELANYFHPLLGPLHPVLSRVFHQRPAEDWRALRRPLGALLVLRKSEHTL